ncbi:alanine racemase [Marinicauda salina]|uniref:alanine racemase n=1 Tax=Marinicauda salina TaxID=2135793 RepID=UPI0022B8B1B2|nr:alanine racemase [Marinicauda salina]
MDRDALARNYARLVERAAPAQVAAVVKADAYGLGAAAIAPRLAREGCRAFFVATAEEGANLRAAIGHREAEIFVFNGYMPGDAALYPEHRLTAILNDPDQLELFAAEQTGPCAIHVDSGINRLGFSTAQVEALAARADLLERLDLRLVLSHLACADEPDHPMNREQLSRFTAAAGRLPATRLSLANTGGVLLGADYHLDMARPGIGLYGGSPFAEADHPFEPVVRVEAPVLQVRALEPGDAVGYGATYVADRQRSAATVALGYADGLPRAVGGSGYGRIAGRKAPVLGRISMDLTVLDVTGLEADAAPGSPAVFLGEDLDAIARAAGTIGYELLTRLGARFQRVYEGAA